MEPSSKYRRSKSPDIQSGVELVDFHGSPRFPHRSFLDTTPTSTPRRGASDEEYGARSETSDSATTSSSGKPSSKRKLNFIPRRRTASHSSDSDKATPTPSPGPLSKVVRIVTPAKSPPVDVHSVDTKISTSAGHYTVAPRDVSVLERISKRAHNQASRIRKPHEVFVELEELRMDPGEEVEWEETARWIKFEEDVEEGSGRWGRPHVSALTFHSLVELRRGLEEGQVLLDVEGEDFPSIAEKVVEALITSDQLPREQKEPVLRILLKKHKHSNDITLWEKLKKSAVNPDGRLHHIGEGLRRISQTQPISGGDGDHAHFEMRHKSMPSFVNHEDVNGSTAANKFKRNSSAPLLDDHKELGGDHTHSSEKKVVFRIAEADSHRVQGIYQASSGFMSGHSDFTDEGVHNVTGTTDTTIDVEVEEEHVLSRPSSDASMQHNKNVLSLMDKIPDEAESLTVLVGGVQFLQKPIVVFVRLDQSHLLGDLTEVPVPVRFIYLLLGPTEGHCDYHEVGRAMATLMSDSQFHDVAYGAVCKKDFLDAMDEFLDDSIVLPPGDWDEELLLPVMHERNELRRRNQNKQEELNQRQEFSINPLKHSRKPLGGLWRDLKLLAKRWPTDFKEILHIQPIISILFLYIAFLAPAIAFGGLMEEITNNEIGETETMVATGLCGIVYGLFSVQPLTVLAFTGPLLLFETVIYRFAVEWFSIPYIEWRAMTSLWLMVILIIVAVTEISFLVKQFTRFSEEIFTGIIAVFFIYETCLSIVHVFDRNPLCGIHYPCGEAAHMTNTCMPIHDDNHTLDNHTFENQTYEPGYTVTMMMMNASAEEIPGPALPISFRICNQPNTGLWSTILCAFTFFIAAFLRKLRHSKLFGKQARRLVSDFGMLTAILLMVIIAYSLRDLIAVEKLVMPPNYATSNTTRGWFINPFGGALTVGEGFGALGPAFLLAILIFIENQLTLLLVNKPEHKLRKKVGYHLDLLIVAILTGVSGLLGMPWLCAAPIRSIQHLQALSVYSTKNPPGEKPKLLFIREQRVTTIVVHILIILTPLAYVVMAIIPISVALGVFFYLAYTSLNGTQLMTRVRLLFTPPKHHPNVHYVRKVRTWKMHVFTIIQVVCVGALFGLKNSPGGMLYPVVIIILVPLRWILGRFFYTHEEIEALDSEEDFPEEHAGHRGEEFGEFEAHVPY